MSHLHRLFLTVEGDNDAYPNYLSARVHLTSTDPAMLEYKNLFVTSPLFSIHQRGCQNAPLIQNGTKVTFLMVPVIFPVFNDILFEFQFSNELWFSLGLANLVIFDNTDDGCQTSNLLTYLEERKLINAYETWVIDDNKISRAIPPFCKNYTSRSPAYSSSIKISERLPLHLKFAVSEFIISVDKFLTASRKFTPHYFDFHKNTIEAANDLVSDLSFLYGDSSYQASDAIVGNLDAESVEEARVRLENPLYKALIEELINDWHGKIIQFNSSMSYIYSQAYSGTFPIFDHTGIVRRHSLLGIGSAIGSLYELLMQLENVFFQLPFEDLSAISYSGANCPREYLELIIDPTLFNSVLWRDDKVKQHLTGTELSQSKKKSPVDFFHRLSFFSGRLGFREYEFSATAAIQVLVESHKLPWHIINYTHEIIHNHVRLILNQLLIVVSPRQKGENIAISKYMDIIEKVLAREIKDNSITYYEYFVTILLKFVINANIFGSLTSPANSTAINDCQGSVEKKMDYTLPEQKELQENMLLYYKDVTEMFVHVIDFVYIYKQQEGIYIMSIWSSWSTIPAVANDIKQYILRSLIILGLPLDGTIDERFDDVILKFTQLLTELKSRHDNIMYSRILELLNDEEDLEDLRYRFYNCMIIGDLVYNFFVGKLETLLDNDDKNTMPKGNLDETGVPKMYYVDRNSFEGKAIKSKVRFLLDQLIYEVYGEKDGGGDDFIERTSAWLLLTLSSN